MDKEFNIVYIDPINIDFNRNFNMETLNVEILKLRTYMDLRYDEKDNFIAIRFILRIRQQEEEIVSGGVVIGIEVTHSLIENLEQGKTKDDKVLSDIVSYVSAFASGYTFSELKGTALNVIKFPYMNSEILIDKLKIEKI